MVILRINARLDKSSFVEERIVLMLSLYFHTLNTLKNSVIIITVFACMASGTSANNVAQSQKMLLDLGFNPGSADGIYGNKTRIALEEFYTSIADVFDGVISANEIMDLSIASRMVYPGCQFFGSPDFISNDTFFDNLRSRFEDAWNERTYYYDSETRYGPFLHWVYEYTSAFVESNQPNSLNSKQAQKLNVLLNRLCFTKKTQTGQRAYAIAVLDLLDSIGGMRGEIHDGHALRWDDFPYIATGNRVISAPQLHGMEHYKKYTSTSGVIIVGGKSISDEAMLAAREMVEYQLSAKPEWHSIIRINKMRISLFKTNTCELPEYSNGCEDGGLAQMEMDATSPINANWLCYPGNIDTGGNPLYHELAHSLQHIILESINDLYFYQTLPTIIKQAYDRRLVAPNFSAGEVWAVAVEGYMMDGGPEFKETYFSRRWIQQEHPEMYQLITRYFPTSPTDYCKF